MLGLLALVCAVVGVVTTVALRDFLVDQLDSQLVAASGRAVGDGPPRGEHGEPRDTGSGPDFLLAPGQAAGTVGARVVSGQVVMAGVLDPSEAGSVRALSPDQSSALAATRVDGRPHSADLGDLGDYRLVARATHDGEVVVIGLPLANVQETVWQLVAIAAAVAGGGLLLAGAAGTLIVRRSLRPLRRVSGTAARVAQLPLDRGEVALSERVPDADTDPRTEVGQVGGALNRMLGHVAAALAARQASETRVRQFVADASHELRTPLAAIRGYAEVTRRIRDSEQSEIAHALRRIEAESVRMSGLVDDLLLLARLDAGRPLARDTVDLSALVVDAVGDAHVAAPDRRWLLDLPQDSVSVPGDAARLHQVLANVLANAHTHTPPGTTVTTAVAAVDGSAVLSVTDDGPGIASQLQHEVFERFVRGDSSRSRAAGSTGLGLAIVAAVVEAHHGQVEVTSRPGRTVLTVRLPTAVDAGPGAARPSEE